MSDIPDFTKFNGAEMQAIADGNAAQPDAESPSNIQPAMPAPPPPTSQPYALGAREAKLAPEAGKEAEPAEGEPVPSKQPTGEVPAQAPQPLNFFPPQAEPMPALPQPAAAPTPTPAIGTPAVQPYKPIDLTATQPTPAQKAEKYFQKEGQQPGLNPMEQFLLGAGHGAVTVGSEGRSLMDYLTGHVTSPSEDWQNKYEAGVPSGEASSMPYKAGDIAGQVAGLAAAPAAVAAASPFEVPTAGAAALALGGAEGGAFGASGAVRQAAKEGREPTQEELAASSELGAGLGAAAGPIGNAIGKGFRAAGKAIGKHFKDRKMLDAQKFFNDIQSHVIQEEQKQLANAQAVLNQAVAPVTSIAKKQLEDLGKLIEGGIGRNVDVGPLKRGAKGRILKRPTEFKGPNPKEAAPELQGQVRGVVRGKGYQRAYDGVPLEKVLPKLPDAIAKPFEAAVNEIARAKVLVEHLKKQVAAYAENAIRLAKEPADVSRIVKEAKAHGDLRGQAADSLAKVRAYLFNEMQKLQGMTHPLANLQLSTTKHVHVDADATQLQTALEPLKKTFVAAAKQAEDANRLLKNAEVHLTTLRERHQGLFQQVDDHLGVPTMVRVMAGAEKFGPSQTVVSIVQQFNPSRAKLVGQWLDRYEQIENGIKAVERNWKEKVSYHFARGAGRQTPQGAEDLLSKAGLIHPTTKAILLAASLGVDSMNARPAHATGTNGTDRIEKQEASITPIMVGVLLGQRFGPAGARAIARSSRFIFHFLYEDTQSLAGMADEMMGKFRGEALHSLERLSDGMNEYRGKLMQMQFVCPDAHGLMAKALAGDATPEEMALITPEGHRFIGEVEQTKQGLSEFIRGYVKEFDEGFHQLSASEQLGAHEIRHAVHLVGDVLSPGKAKTMSAGDMMLSKIFARSAAFNFTLNWKIATTAWLHDMAAYGGMHLGVPSVYAAYAQYASRPTLRRLVNGLHIGGAVSEVEQAVNKVANPYRIEVVHNQLAFLGSLNRQYHALSPEQMQHLGVTSPTDFAEKVMTQRLAQQQLARIYEEAALDVSRTTGADVSRLNQTGMERAYLLGNITKYTRYIMIDQRLIAQNVKGAVVHFYKGETALGLQKLGRLAHTIAVKAQYAGAKGALPVTAYAALMSNPYTSQATANIANAIDNISLGLKVFGDLGEHGRWDPVISPLMGQRLPGFDDGIEAFKEVMTLQGDINKMVQVLGSGDPGALLAGSKENEDVKKGQRALATLITNVGFLFPKLGMFPTRFIRDAVKAFPDLVNKEHSIGVASPWPIGERTKPVQGAKLFGYAALPDQTEEQADIESTVDAIGEFAGRKPGPRARRLAQETYVKNANRDTDADVLDPEEAAALLQK
jgi:hypothetical protein